MRIAKYHFYHSTDFELVNSQPPDGILEKPLRVTQSEGKWD